MEFLKEWHTLLGEPKWRGKTTSAIEKTLEQLKRFDVKFSTGLVSTAIANNWQGVTYDSTPTAYAKWQQQTGQGVHSNNGAAADRRIMTETEKNALNITAAADAIWKNIENRQGVFATV